MKLIKHYRILKVFLALVLVSFFCRLDAQTKSKDSLELLFRSIEEDSIAFSRLSESANLYRDRDSELHYYVIKKGINRAIKTQNRKAESSFTRELGIYYRKKGNLDSAIINYTHSLNLNIALKDSFNINIVKSSLANALKAKGDFQSAIRNFNEALTYFKDNGEKYKMRALITQFNLAGVYISMKQWKTADLLLEQVYSDSLTKKNKILLKATTINLCATRQETNQLDDALAYAKIAEDLAKDPRSLADLSINIGTIFEEKKQHKKAYDYFLKGLNHYQELKSDSGIILAFNNLGNNAIQRKKYEKAEFYLLEAKKLLEQNKNLKSYSYNQKTLADLYEKQGEFKKALFFLKKDIVLTDSILGTEKQEAIANLEVKFETEQVKKDRDIAEKKSKILALENQKSKTLLTTSLVIIILILTAAYLYFGRLKTKRKATLTTLELKETKRRLALEKQYKNSELRALKAQMNPHFIFNALNSVQEYIISNKKNEASEYLGRFADLIRRYLVQSDLEYITIEEEVSSLQTYLSLEALRFEEEFIYSISLSEALQERGCQIPTMLVQPFVENAITHGLLHKDGKCKLLVSFTKGEENTIVCIVEDNGVGRGFAEQVKSKSNRHHQSFSIGAIEERLRLFSEKTGDKIKYSIIDLKEDEVPKGTKVILVLPIKIV